MSMGLAMAESSSSILECLFTAFVWGSRDAILRDVDVDIAWRVRLRVAVLS